MRDWFAKLGAVSIATSGWAITEFASALAAKGRRRDLRPREIERAWRDFTTLCDDDLHILEVDRTTFFAGADFIRMKGSELAAGDALYLAAARGAGVSSLATFERAMRRSALKLGIELAAIPGT